MVLGQLVTAAEAVGKLLDKPLRASLAFRIGKLSKDMAPHMETFEKIRGELLEKYGEQVESEDLQEGQVSYTFENGGAEKFSTELQEMLDEKVEGFKVKKIKLKELDGVDLTGRDMMALEWLISEK